MATCINCNGYAAKRITVTHHKDNGPTKAGSVIVTDWCQHDLDNVIPDINLQMILDPGAFDVVVTSHPFPVDCDDCNSPAGTPCVIGCPAQD